MASDPSHLWDFTQPELSEQRFREALATANPDDALILQTQIARTYGLRGHFARAQEILQNIESQIATASVEARVRYELEFGRTLASAKHAADSQTSDVKGQARGRYLRALELAKAGQLDALAIDAIHMLAFVDTAPEDQLKWGHEALSIALASSRPAARKWEASLRNNVGYALHQLKRYDDALSQFQQAVVVRECADDAEATRAAHWMIGWTLRALNRLDEALAIQLRLERECEAAGVPDPYVFDELEALCRAQGDEVQATRYAKKRKQLTR
ncbi:MAG: tetratricopeptide repeat protein [Pseudomonadota bacterium]|nr:tetratricopeptide repeat protein [Pseudomonadota bacterium]